MKNTIKRNVINRYGDLLISSDINGDLSDIVKVSGSSMQWNRYCKLIEIFAHFNSVSGKHICLYMDIPRLLQRRLYDWLKVQNLRGMVLFPEEIMIDGKEEFLEEIIIDTGFEKAVYIKSKKRLLVETMPVLQQYLEEQFGE